MSLDPVEKRRSVTANSLLSVVAWGVPIFLGFISTPILVSKLGSEQYGLFAVILGFISYWFTFGIGKVAAKFIPEFQAAGERPKVTQVVAATFWLSLAIGFVSFGVLLLTAPLIVRDILLISPELYRSAVNSIYLAGAIVLVLMLSQLSQFVLQGLHRFDHYVTITTLNGLLVGGGNIFLALTGFGVVTLIAWNLAVATATAFLFYLRAVSLLPDTRLVVSIPRSMLVTVARYAGHIVLYQLFANILFIFERSWIVRRFGADSLTFYLVPMLLAIYMQGFIASVVQAIFPVINELLADKERLIQIYQRSSKMILLIVVLVLTSLIACGHLFLALWVSPELAARSYTLLVPHILSFGLISMCVMPWQLAEAFGYSVMNVIMTGVWMAVGVPLMIISVDVFHAEGVAWSRFAAVLITFPMTFYVERRFLGKLHVRFWLFAGMRVLAAALVLFGIETLLLRILPATWPALILVIGLGTLAFALVLLVSGFITEEDKRFAGRLLRNRWRVGEQSAFS